MNGISMKQKNLLYVNKPIFREGVWSVDITNGNSLLAEIIESHGSTSRETAYQIYRRIKKELGEGL